MFKKKWSRLSILRFVFAISRRSFGRLRRVMRQNLRNKICQLCYETTPCRKTPKNADIWRFSILLRCTKKWSRLSNVQKWEIKSGACWKLYINFKSLIVIWEFYTKSNEEFRIIDIQYTLRNNFLNGRKWQMNQKQVILGHKCKTNVVTLLNIFEIVF